jgi:hypothetical protein
VGSPPNPNRITLITSLYDACQGQRALWIPLLRLRPCGPGVAAPLGGEVGDRRSANCASSFAADGAESVGAWSFLRIDRHGTGRDGDRV